MKKVTIKDVADKAGVSKGTVSAVINSRSSVKSSTRDLVLSVMRELNFRPKGMARTLKGETPQQSIGLIIKDLNNPFYTAIALGVKKYANSRGYLVLITSSENQHSFERASTQIFSSKDIKGTIIAPILEGSSEIEHLFNLKMLNYPFVLLEDVPGIQANVVTYDAVTPITNMVKKIMEMGHKKIVHFAGPVDNSTHANARIEGFKKAFTESPYAFSNDMIYYAPTHFEEAKKSTFKYFKKLNKKNYPTAIVCFNDQQAFGVMSALKELNIKVPEDISLTGIDDIYYSQLFPVPLTTIRAPQVKIGIKAAEILIKNIESDVVLPPEKVVLETELVFRNSTKSLK